MSSLNPVDFRDRNTLSAHMPRHRQVVDTVMRDIASGRFRPGDRLPTEIELAKTFSASRSTIGRALRELKKKGLLDRQRGAGTRIAALLQESVGAEYQSKKIALFAPFAQSPADLGWIGSQIHGHLSELAAHRSDHLRLQLISRTNGDRLTQMLTAAQTLIDDGIAGVFYYPAELPQDDVRLNQLVVEKLILAGVAVVLIDRDLVPFPHRSKFFLVTYDNRRGAYLATSHVIEQGCKRIAFIGTSYVSTACSERLRGYQDACADHGISVDNQLIQNTLFEELDISFTRSVMDKKPDAIICKMDHYAALIGRHLVELGVAIGRDVLLTGFDDQMIAELLQVPLTTIRFPPDPFVQVCYDRLLAQMENPQAPLPGTMLIGVELVIRESTMRP